MLGGKRKNLLTVVIGEKLITFFERGGKSASVALPAGFSWEKPGGLGQEIKAALREKNITERHAMIALPSRWVLVKPVQLPPADAAAATGILRLTIEREYQVDAKDWVFDFAGEVSSKERRSVLLAATPGARLAQAAAVLEQAGLHPEVISSTMFELIAKFSGAVLHLSPEGAELGASAGKGPALIERLASTPTQPAALAAEVRRVLAASNVSAESIAVVSGGQADAQIIRSVTEQIGLRAEVASGDAAKLIAETVDWAPQVARINFLKSKLANVPDRWLTRPRAGFITAAGLLAAMLLFLVGDWYTQKSNVDDLRDTLASMKNEIAMARVNVDRMKLANGWYDKRPAVLDCAQAITLAFPSAGQAWTTSLSVRDDMSPRGELSGTLVGKAQSDRIVLELLDRLRATKGISEVNLLYRRPAERNSKTEAFALTFTYTSRE